MRPMDTGILIFDDAEELDFAGPWEVFGMAAELRGKGSVVAIGEQKRPVRASKGLRVVPDFGFDDAPPIDVVVVPGGQGTRREVNNGALVEWLRQTAKSCTWVTSVCTGTLLLHEAGIARGKRVTTHWSFVETLRARGDVTVVADERWVVDGSLVTAAGVSAGIDMALWLVGQIDGVDFARNVQRAIEYHPAPPYGG